MCCARTRARNGRVLGWESARTSLTVAIEQTCKRSYQHAVSCELNRDPEFACGKLSSGWDANCRRGDGYGRDQLDRCHRRWRAVGDGDLYGQPRWPGDHAQALRVAAWRARVSYS